MSSEEKKEKYRIIQVSNVSVSATGDHIFTLFQYVGRIDDFKVYPSDDKVTSNTTQKFAFVKFQDERCVEVAQHLTNTVLIDRALVCVPWIHDAIPDEETFLNSGGTAAGTRLLPPHVVNKVQTDNEGSSLLLTVDPTLEQLGLPSYPPLPGDTDPAKVEEIRRTIYVGNLPKGVEGQAVLDFFGNYIGEVMYVRMATGPDTLPCAYAYVEFSQQTTVPIALQNNGIEFQGRNLKIQHSRVAIIKPQQKSADQALEEVEEAIRMGRTEPRRSRSPSRRRRSPSPPRRRSRERRRSRSRDSRDSRRRRSRDRKRSRSRDRKRSRSRDRRRSRSKDRRSHRSRSRDRKERSRSRDRKRSRSRDRKKDRKESKRSRSRSRDRKVKNDEHRPEKKDREIKKKESDDEESLREKLLQSTGLTNDEKANGRNSADRTPSRIKNERKRALSDSD